MLLQDARPVELARRLNTCPQAVTRLLRADHVSKIDTLKAALAALGLDPALAAHRA